MSDTISTRVVTRTERGVLLDYYPPRQGYKQPQWQISTASTRLTPRGSCLSKCSRVNSPHSSPVRPPSPGPVTSSLFSSPGHTSSHSQSHSSARILSHSHSHHSHASPGPPGIHPAPPGSPLLRRPSTSGIQGMLDSRRYFTWRDHDGQIHFQEHNSQASSSKSASSGPSPPKVGPRGV